TPSASDINPMRPIAGADWLSSAAKTVTRPNLFRCCGGCRIRARSSFFSGANMTRLSMRALLALSLVAVPLVASAHHSIQAQFDIYKTIQVTGTVARIEFINPHSYLTVNVKAADGKVTKWAFEMTGLAGLRRAGLSRADRGGLKPGDALTVIALAARDG